MEEKKITEDSIKLEQIACKKEERAESDRKYAIKLVEKIVFYMIGAIMIAFLAAVISMVIKK